MVSWAEQCIPEGFWSVWAIGIQFQMPLFYSLITLSVLTALVGSETPSCSAWDKLLRPRLIIMLIAAAVIEHVLGPWARHHSDRCTITTSQHSPICPEAELGSVIYPKCWDLNSADCLTPKPTLYLTHCPTSHRKLVQLIVIPLNARFSFVKLDLSFHSSFQHLRNYTHRVLRSSFQIHVIISATVFQINDSAHGFPSENPFWVDITWGQ